MIYMGLVIDEAVKKDMSKEQIMAMEMYYNLKAQGMKNIKVSVFRSERSTNENPTS